MPSFIARRFCVIAAVLLAFGVLLPTIAEASTFALPTPPLPPDFEGTGTVGQDPVNALAINGTVHNTLVPGQPVWYQVNGSGKAPLAVTVDTNPANVAGNAVQMHVDWQTPTGMQNADWPGFYRIGDGTSSGFGPGVLYWQTGDHTSNTYFVELLNTSSEPVNYAIALTGSQFPPPILDPSAPTPLTSS